MIKKILIALVVAVVLFVGVVAAAVFIAPTDLKVEREITINKPHTEIYDYARILKNQNDWGPWHKKEPTMHQEFRGTDGQVGFVSYWKGKHEEIGEGEQEIKGLVEGKEINTELRFKQPYESRADAYMTMEPAGANQTKVKWGINFSMPRPMNAMCLIMDMDAMMGKDLNEGLAGLKSIVESR
jgi:hypothetical protein